MRVLGFCASIVARSCALVLCITFAAPVFGAAEMCPDGSIRLFNPSCGQAEGPGEEEFVPGCEGVFGPRPVAREFPDHRAYRAARNLWLQDMRQCEAVGRPPWASVEEVRLAEGVYDPWDMGRPAFYKGRYGWMARFPGSKPNIPFEAAAWAAIFRPHLLVAAFQIDAFTDGFEIEECHPFTPPIVCKEESAFLRSLPAVEWVSLRSRAHGAPRPVTVTRVAKGVYEVEPR